MVKQQNFVVKNMAKMNIGKTSFHKDKRFEERQRIRGKKYKKDYRQDY